MGVFEVVLEGQAVIVFLLVMIADKIGFAEGDVVASFEPLHSFFSMLLKRKYRKKHALTVKGGLFNDVHDGESSWTCFSVFKSEEKPDVIAIGIEVVLYHQVVFALLADLPANVGLAHISRLKVRVYAILLNLRVKTTGLFKLFERLPIVVGHGVEAFELSREVSMIGAIGL